MMRWVATVRADLAAGFGLLTRLPVGWLVPAGAPWRPGRAVWVFPLAGAVAGAVTGLVLMLGHRLGLPPLLSAAWALAAAILLTGGLHEDGLSDTADGYGGGRDRMRRLEIMRDSRIGSFGAIALCLSLLLRAAALAALPPAALFAAPVAAAVLGRAAMPVLLRVLPPARTDGLGHGVGQVPPLALALTLLIAAGFCAVLLPPLRAVLAAGLAVLVAAASALLARRKIGGQTGDVLGATAVAVECAVLTLLAAR